MNTRNDGCRQYPPQMIVASHDANELVFVECYEKVLVPIWIQSQQLMRRSDFDALPEAMAAPKSTNNEQSAPEKAATKIDRSQIPEADDVD